MRYYNTGDMLEALNAGEINCLSTRSPSAAFSRKLAKLIASDYSTTTYEMLIPNLDEASAMSDVRVRKAVMYAIDRATLVSNAYLDMAQQSEVPIIPGTWLYESQSAVYYHSPERALTLLNEAGWTDLTGTAKLSRLKNGLLVDLNVEIVTYVEANSYVRKNAAEQIAANLRAVGIQATVTALSMNDAASRVKRGNFDLALVAVNLSEVPNLFPLFSQNGAINYSGSHTAEMDQLLSRTATAASEDELKQAYGDLELHIVDRLPIMGLVFRTGTVLSTRTLAGLSGMREYDALNGLEFVKK
ncbi:MAG: Heme-binding protein A precursor [Firmicutes bacterium ADurb.Bin467]|nr:MAG: Heme-binding protein A precursor [Firmicutes bacterium ADurb.Bin467]